MKITITIDGKPSTYSSFGKRKILGLGSTISNRNMGSFRGHACVNYGHGFKSDFDFVDAKDWREKIAPCIEDELLDYLGVKRV